MKFLVHGSIAYDLLLQAEGSFADAIDPKALKNLSVSFFAPHLRRHHGGTGANIAWNIRLLGHEPLLVGAVGRDGGPYLSLLEERGIPVGRIEQKPDTVTATAIIGTDNGERQITFFHPGADTADDPPDLSEDREDISFAVIAPRNPVFMLKAAAQCAKLRIPYLFDPGQQSHVFGREEFRRAVSGSHGMVVNEYEWSLASAKLGWNEGDTVKDCGLLVRTLGEEGIRLLSRGEEVTIPAAKPDKFVNPTGAGDAVRAGLLLGLAENWSLTDTGRLCAILGSLVVEQEGTMLDSLTNETIQERAQENYGAMLPL